MNKEAKFLGALIPSHPDYLPIIQAVREKYNLHEVDPDGEPITEIYLGDEIIPLEDFRQEIKALIIEKTDYLPEQISKVYKGFRLFVDKPISDIPEFAEIPDSLKDPINGLVVMAQASIKPILAIVEAHFDSIANMLYIHLLTGETEEIPTDWINIVTTAKVFDNTLIFVAVDQLADPETTVQQFRQLYAKTFGKHRPKITKNAVSTAYYLQLQRAGKPWDFIVEEFIRLNKYSLPRDRASKRYFDTRQKYAQLLKKRMQRSKTVLEVLLGDKK